MSERVLGFESAPTSSSPHVGRAGAVCEQGSRARGQSGPRSDRAEEPTTQSDVTTHQRRPRGVRSSTLCRRSTGAYGVPCAMVVHHPGCHYRHEGREHEGKGELKGRIRICPKGGRSRSLTGGRGQDNMGTPRASRPNHCSEGTFFCDTGRYRGLPPPCCLRSCKCRIETIVRHGHLLYPMFICIHVTEKYSVR